jgi:uncharacterized protein (TIGR00106 family)|tara:strand:+ start:3432 stop:3731 length:300 start_codon:yes stop_codon:yes gene_type:complete
MLAEFSITPIDKEGKSLSEYIAKTINIIKESGLQYELHAMGTIVEGDAEEVFDLIKKCHLNMARFSDRVSTSIKIDDRKGATGRLKGKVASVENKLKKS